MSRTRKRHPNDDGPVARKRYERSKALREFEQQYRSNNLDPHIYL